MAQHGRLVQATPASASALRTNCSLLTADSPPLSACCLVRSVHCVLFTVRVCPKRRRSLSGPTSWPRAPLMHAPLSVAQPQPLDNNSTRPAASFSFSLSVVRLSRSFSPARRRISCPTGRGRLFNGGQMFPGEQWTFSCNWSPTGRRFSLSQLASSWSQSQSGHAWRPRSRPITRSASAKWRLLLATLVSSLESSH